MRKVRILAFHVTILLYSHDHARLQDVWVSLHSHLLRADLKYLHFRARDSINHWRKRNGLGTFYYLHLKDVDRVAQSV